MTNSKRCVIFLTLHFNSQKAAAEGGLTTTQGGLGPACAQEKHLEQQTALPGPSTRKHPNQKFNRESYTCIYRYIHMHISVYLSHICRNAHLHTRNVPPKRSNTRPPLQDGKSQTPQKHQNGGDGHLRRFSQCTSSSPKPRKSLLAHTKHTTFNFFSNLV